MLLPTAAFAAIEDIDPYQKIFNEQLGSGFQEEPLFMKYSLINYRLDYTTNDQTSSGASTFLLINTILSFCMVGMALAAKLTIDIMTWAFSYNAIDLLIDNINQIVDKLVDDLFFSELFAIGLFGLGISLFFTFSRREDVAGKLMKVIFNLVIAFTLLANMGTIISSLNQLSKWGSDVVFIAFESAVGSEVKQYDDDKGKNAFLNVSEKFFEYNVHIPWQLGEFGHYVPSTKTDLTEEEQQLKAKTEEILSQDVTADNQQQNTDQQNTNTSTTSLLSPAKFTNRFSGESSTTDNQQNSQQNNNSSISMSAFGIPYRIFVIWLTFIVGTLYGCLLLAIAGTAIICQFLMYLLAIVSPLVFLLLLIPDWGDRMLIKWMQGLITSAVYKILASFLLITILVLQSKIYDVSQGWAYAMFAQVVLVFAVFIFRRNIMDYIPLPGVAASHYTENTLFDKGKSIVDKTFGTMVDRAKVTVVGPASAGLATGNPALVSQREAVDTSKNTESVQNRSSVLENLRNMLQTNDSMVQSKSETQSSKTEKDRFSLRGKTQLENDESQKTIDQRLRRTSTSDGYVRVGEVKEAIDRLANKNKMETKVKENSVKGQLDNQNLLRSERRPVDVRVVEMTPLPNLVDKFVDDSVDKRKRRPVELDKETLEMTKRTVTPRVKEEKVEEVQVGRRRVSKLDLPELQEEQELDEQTNENEDEQVKEDEQTEKTNQQQAEGEELDPKQMLEQQVLGPELEIENEQKSKKQQKKKKGNWMNKMSDKFKK